MTGEHSFTYTAYRSLITDSLLYLLHFMTRSQYVSRLEKQLKQLNEVIDFKIMHGMRYSIESRKHRMILQKIREQRRSQIFGRLFPLSLNF